MNEIINTNNLQNIQSIYQTHQTPILLLSSLLGFFFIFYLTNIFQKKFSKKNHTNKFILFVISIFVFFAITQQYLITSNILSLNNNTNKNNSFINNDKTNNNNNFVNNSQKTSEENLTYFLLALNFLFYIIIPFAYFILIEETNINCTENNSNDNLYTYESYNNYINNNNNNNNNKDFEALNLNLNLNTNNLNMIGLTNGSGINEVNYTENEFDYLRVFKNFYFYLIILISLNVIFLINYKIFSINPKKLLEIYSFIPEKMRINATFNSDMEFLLYINTFNIYLIFKIFSIFYLPYGLGKLISLQIDNMKNNVQINIEYKRLNTNLSKNHELIKQITTQKLMTGKNLTKKEKLILRQCKENNTHLDYKQEILEEKYSKIKVFLEYLFLPFKFMAIIFTIFLTIVIIFSKISAIYSNLFQSNCGFYCGYYSDKIISSIGFEDIYEYILSKYMLNINQNQSISQNNFYKNFIIFSIWFIYVYVLLALFFSLKNLGLINFTCNIFSKEFYAGNNNDNNNNNYSSNNNNRFFFLSISEIRNNKISTFSVYVIYLIFAVFGISEVLNMSNKIGNFMENFNRCNLNLISDNNCNYSYYMLFGLKNSFNFSIGMILIQILEIVSVLLLFVFAILLPIKSTSAFFMENKNENENINFNNYSKCPENEIEGNYQN
jgi:hypothetical protein